MGTVSGLYGHIRNGTFGGLKWLEWAWFLESPNHLQHAWPLKIPSEKLGTGRTKNAMQDGKEGEESQNKEVKRQIETP